MAKRAASISTLFSGPDNFCRVVKLVKNFRSHQAIIKFPNERFYGGDLEQCGDRKVIDFFLNSPLLGSPNFPIIFHAVHGKDDREASSPSFFNIDEVTLVKDYVQKLRADRRFRISKLLRNFAKGTC